MTTYPTGWVVTGPNGRVLHFSAHDGWKVEAVTFTDAAPAAVASEAPAEPTREPVILEVKRGRFCPHCNPCLHDDDCLRPSEIAKRAADDGVRGFPHAAPAAEPVAQQPPPRHAAGCHIWDGDDCDCFLSQPEAPPTQDDDLVARIESRSRGRTASGDALIVPLDVLHAEAERIRELEAKNGSLRELMNCYNLGGWTDAERLQRERDEARRELAASRERERAGIAVMSEFVAAWDASHDPTIVGSTCRLIRAESAMRDFLADVTPDSAAEQGGAE